MNVWTPSKHVPWSYDCLKKSSRELNTPKALKCNPQNATINLYTWHKSKESVFLQVQQENNWIFRAIAPRISGKKIWRSDQLIWFGTGTLKFSHSVCLWIKQYGSFSWSNVEISNRNSTFSFPQKKRASKILPHDGVFGWPQFQKK